MDIWQGEKLPFICTAAVNTPRRRSFPHKLIADICGRWKLLNPLGYFDKWDSWVRYPVTLTYFTGATCIYLNNCNIINLFSLRNCLEKEEKSEILILLQYIDFYRINQNSPSLAFLRNFRDFIFLHTYILAQKKNRFNKPIINNVSEAASVARRQHSGY